MESIPFRSGGWPPKADASKASAATGRFAGESRRRRVSLGSCAATRGSAATFLSKGRGAVAVRGGRSAEAHGRCVSAAKERRIVGGRVPASEDLPPQTQVGDGPALRDAESLRRRSWPTNLIWKRRGSNVMPAVGVATDERQPL